MVGAIDFMNHWKAICDNEADCKKCRIKTNCPGCWVSDMSKEKILAFIGEVEMNFERKKKFGGYPADGEA